MTESKRPGRKPRIDWVAAKAWFLADSTATLEQVGEKFKAHPSSVRQRAATERWVKERQQFAAEIERKATAKLSDRKVNELADFNAADLKIAKAIRALVARELGKFARGDDLDHVVLRSLTATAESAQRMGRLALGAETASGVTPHEAAQAAQEAIAAAMATNGSPKPPVPASLAR